MINYNAQNKCKIMYIVARNASTQLNKIIKRKEKKKKSARETYTGSEPMVMSTLQSKKHFILFFGIHYTSSL